MTDGARVGWGMRMVGTGGSDEALAELLATRGGALRRFGYLMCGDWTDAEDLLQEALVRSLGRSVGADPARLEGYVRKAIVRLVIDEGRRRALRSRLLPRITASHARSDEQHETWAGAVTVRTALLALPTRQRVCAVLYYHEDQPVAAIGHSLGCSEGTVKRHLHAARRALLAVLSDVNQEGDRRVDR